METFIVSVVAFALAMLLLSVGTILGRRYLRGSCGGLGARRDAQGDFVCGCGTPSEHCREADRPPAAEEEEEEEETDHGPHDSQRT